MRIACATVAQLYAPIREGGSVEAVPKWITGSVEAQEWSGHVLAILPRGMFWRRPDHRLWGIIL